MLNLRDRAISRECFSKDSFSAEDELPGDALEMSAVGGRDRRVTFGMRQDHPRLESPKMSFPLRKCASVSFQHVALEKRLRTMSHEN